MGSQWQVLRGGQLSVIPGKEFVVAQVPRPRCAIERNYQSATQSADVASGLN